MVGRGKDVWCPFSHYLFNVYNTTTQKQPSSMVPLDKERRVRAAIS